MKISITFRHTEPVDAIKDYINEKMDKLTRLAHKPIEAHVVLIEEKHNRTADVTLNAKNLTARGEVTTDDFYASIDGAVSKVEKTLRRFKGKKADGKGFERGLPLAGEDSAPS